jgi:hypothetical protein
LARLPKIGGVEAIFNCGATAVGTKGETDIPVQRRLERERRPATPITEEQTQAVPFERTRSNGYC